MGKVALHILGPLVAIAGYIYHLRVQAGDSTSWLFLTSLILLATSNFLMVVLLAILIKKTWTKEAISYRTAVEFLIGLAVGDYFFFIAQS